MTVLAQGDEPGQLLTVQREDRELLSDGVVSVDLKERTGEIHSDLRLGADVGGAACLQANAGLTSNGVMLRGRGFLVDNAADSAESEILRPIKNGNDVLQKPRNCLVIDFNDMPSDEALRRFPGAFQRVQDYVKPERDHAADRRFRTLWWQFGRPRPAMRKMLAGLPRYIGTPETSKQRVFVFLEQRVLAEHPLIAIALSDAFYLGILSSNLHVTWALEAGGTLESRPRYNKTVCFEPFPFPECSEEQTARIRELGEMLDAHRKRQQELHPGLTLTSMYNVVAKLRTGEPLTAKERKVHEQGLCSVLKQIHDDLDGAVFDAYGWPPTLTDDEVLERLVELNHERAEEEKGGLVRWLRPEFQAPDAASARVPGKELSREPQLLEAKKVALGTASPGLPKATTKKMKKPRQPWPSTVPAQVQAVRSALLDEQPPVTAQVLARRFEGRKAPKIQEILETLVMLGQARRVEGGYGV